jgi:hypothetical protein
MEALFSTSERERETKQDWGLTNGYVMVLAACPPGCSMGTPPRHRRCSSVRRRAARTAVGKETGIAQVKEIRDGERREER